MDFSGIKLNSGEEFTALVIEADPPSHVDFLVARRKLLRFNLIKTNKEFIEARKRYNSLYAEHQSLAEQHSILDREISFIEYEATQLKQKQAKQQAKATKSKQPVDEAKKLVMKMLANLPPEQREAILANMQA
jgi:predicted  nucleic acid-binding Zn-ribbon protein